MLFSSLVFIFIFLPLSLVLYYLIPNRNYRNIILLVFSLIFYAWGEPIYVILMVIEITINYFMAIWIDKSNELKQKKFLIIMTIIIDLGILGFYKYSNFLISIINSLTSLNIGMIDIALPIGISFYTFQILSYMIDVYRCKVKVQKNILFLATYVTMFPQLIAGPIVRYETIEDELVNRKESLNNFTDGLRRFIIGLGKKIIIANNIAIIANKIFVDLNGSEYTFMIAWMAAIAYSLQIYFDFSGYSDMAIGLGKMFGFNFLENFNYPYIAQSITDFWHRWHISLSSWFRDYVYIPLGGNRVSKLRWFINIMIVWMLTGLWHGASYNFIIWGLYYGLILIIEKLFLLKLLKKAPILNNIYSLIIIIFGFVIFNSSSLAQIQLFFNNMFLTTPYLNFSVIEDLGIVYLIPYVIVGILGCTPLAKNIFAKLDKNPFSGILYDIYLLFILLLCVMFLVNNSYNPFIYFRF